MGTSYNYTDAKINIKRSAGMPSRNFKMKKSLKLERVSYLFEIPQREIIIIRWNSMSQTSAFCSDHTPTLILAPSIYRHSTTRRCDSCSQWDTFGVMFGGKRIGTHVIRREK